LGWVSVGREQTNVRLYEVQPAGSMVFETGQQTRSTRLSGVTAMRRTWNQVHRFSDAGELATARRLLIACRDRVGHLWRQVYGEKLLQLTVSYPFFAYYFE
jgi:hypothetical protein